MSYLTQMAGLAYHNFMSAADRHLLAIASSAASPAARLRRLAIFGWTWSAATSGFCCRLASSGL